MEWIPATHIEHITIEPDFDRQEVFIEVDTALCDALPMLRICVMTPDAKQVLFRQSLTPKSNLAIPLNYRRINRSSVSITSLVSSWVSWIRATGRMD